MSSLLNPFSLSSEWPILIVHRGSAPYLKCCLSQLRKTNPERRILLLGDESNRSFAEPALQIEHSLLNSPDAEEFARRYVHQSGLAYGFELFCFQRWFYLRDQIRRAQFKNGLVLDSDVLLYCDVMREQARFAPKRMTLSRFYGPQFQSPETTLWCGHNNFIRDEEILNQFCDFLLEQYATVESIEKLGEVGLKTNGKRWVSDMLLFSLFYRRHLEEITPLDTIDGEAAQFDNFLTEVNPFRAARTRWGVGRRKCKRVCFREGVPYVFHEELRKEIRLKSIHFHGRHKYLMKYWMTGKNAPGREWFDGLYQETAVSLVRRVKKWLR